MDVFHELFGEKWPRDIGSAQYSGIKNNAIEYPNTNLDLIIKLQDDMKITCDIVYCNLKHNFGHIT